MTPGTPRQHVYLAVVTKEVYPTLREATTVVGVATTLAAAQCMVERGLTAEIHGQQVRWVDGGDGRTDIRLSIGQYGRFIRMEGLRYWGHVERHPVVMEETA